METNFQGSLVKGLETKNLSQTNWCVFVAVLEELLQNNQSLQNFCFWGCKEALLLLIWHSFFVLCGKKVPIIQKGMFANYADLYCRILSDAMLREEKT